MATGGFRPCGDFRTAYAADNGIFPTRGTLALAIAAIAVVALMPVQVGGWQAVSNYWLVLLIQIGIYGIAALGLNILVGFTGQISLGHSAFFGFGAFASAWLNNHAGVPVFFSIPLAGVATTLLGLVIGIPAARIKGLYLAIATLASQFILQDFFGRAEWFTGGASGAIANPFNVLGLDLSGDRKYFWVVLAWFVVTYVMATNLMRTRDGRAFVAVRDHYLSAEIMGINLTKYRILAFGISSFYAGIAGALYGHYIGFVSVEPFDLLLSIQFLGMIIIGGLGSIMGSLLGTVFIMLLPEAIQGLVKLLQATDWGQSTAISQGLAYMKEMAIGLAIMLFLIFEPSGLAASWRKLKAYWKLYPFSY